MRISGYLLLGMVAACADEAAPIPETLLGQPAGPVTLVREAKGTEAGGYDLFLPARPIPINHAVWVLEQGNDRLVRFDSTLTHAQTYSREGEGPGEIQFAQDLSVDGDRFIVAETGNGRLSIFDTAGVFRSSISTPKSPRFATAAAGRVLATFDPQTEYAYAVDTRGRLTPHASIPEELERLAASNPRTFLPAGAYIATSVSGELIVLDQSVLALSVFAPTGARKATRLLPEPFRSRLLDQRVTERAGWGGRAAAFVDSPAAKRIYLDREGRLVVLFPLPDSWGLLIDTKSWTARPLMLPADRRLRDILWAASDATLDGDRLYVLSGSQLYEFAVEDWR